MTDAIQRVPTPMDLMQLAISKEGSIDVIERLAKLQQDFMDREARVAFAQAFQTFKENLPKILKTKHVHFKGKDGKQDTDYWHVELDKACDLLIPALNAVGLTHRWGCIAQPGGGIIVTCYLKHRLGYEETGASLPGTIDTSGGKNAIQGVGSSLTYLNRYTLLATCGIAPTGMDDDAQIKPAMPDLQEWLDKISLSQGLDELKTVYFKARDAAIAADDRASEKKLGEAKNNRVKELKRGQL